MREVPVDAGAFLANVGGVVAIEPVEDFETKNHATNRDGVPKWKLQLLYKRPGVRKRDVIEVGFAAHEHALPAMSDAQKGLFFRGLRAMLWEQGGRHGLSLSCDEFSFGPWRSAGRTETDGGDALADAA